MQRVLEKKSQAELSIQILSILLVFKEPFTCFRCNGTWRNCVPQYKWSKPWNYRMKINSSIFQTAWPASNTGLPPFWGFFEADFQGHQTFFSFLPVVFSFFKKPNFMIFRVYRFEEFCRRIFLKLPGDFLKSRSPFTTFCWLKILKFRNFQGHCWSMVNPSCILFNQHAACLSTSTTFRSI